MPDQEWQLFGNDPVSLSEGLFVLGFGITLLVVCIVLLRVSVRRWSRSSHASPYPTRVPTLALVVIPVYLALQFLGVLIAQLALLASGLPLGSDGAQWWGAVSVSLAMMLVAPFTIVLLGSLGGVGCLGFRSMTDGCIKALWGGLVFLPGFIGVNILWAICLALTGGETSEQVPVDLARRLIVCERFELLLGTVIAAVLVAPFVEELVFRGVVFRSLAQRLGETPGIVVSGLIFGAIHINLQAVVPLSVLGMFLALLYARTRNIWAPIFLHSFFNLSQLLALWRQAQAG